MNAFNRNIEVPIERKKHHIKNERKRKSGLKEIYITQYVDNDKQWILLSDERTKW